MWTPAPGVAIRIQPAEATAPDVACFDPWAWPAPKSVRAEGAELTLVTHADTHTSHWIMSPELRDGVACSYVLPAGTHLAMRIRALQRHVAALERAHILTQTFARPHRAALVDMRTLQALDASLAGATHRDIAGAVFGAPDVAARWHPDGELRAQVRHLVRRGQRLMLGGYRQLLDGIDTAPRRFA